MKFSALKAEINIASFLLLKIGISFDFYFSLKHDIITKFNVLAIYSNIEICDVENLHLCLNHKCL